VTQRAVFRLGPLVTADVWENRTLVREGRWYYSTPSAFRLVRGASVCVDHDKHPIGKLLDQPYRWSDGAGEWLACRAEITDPPAWLKEGTPASIGFLDHDVVTTRFGAGTRFGGGLILEVSLVSPNEKPRDEMAQVVLLREITPLRLTREQAYAEVERRVGTGEDVEEVVRDLVERLDHDPQLKAAYTAWQSARPTQRRLAA
jgi:hypothetical protein